MYRFSVGIRRLPYPGFLQNLFRWFLGQALIDSFCPLIETVCRPGGAKVIQADIPSIRKQANPCQHIAVGFGASAGQILQNMQRGRLLPVQTPPGSCDRPTSVPGINGRHPIGSSFSHKDVPVQNQGIYSEFLYFCMMFSHMVSLPVSIVTFSISVFFQFSGLFQK